VMIEAWRRFLMRGARKKVPHAVAYLRAPDELVFGYFPTAEAEGIWSMIRQTAAGAPLQWTSTTAPDVN
jgi:hypothetical protein